MGIALVIIGAIVAVIGLLAVLATLNSTIALIAALLFCLIGVTTLVGGCVVEAIDKLRRMQAHKPPI